MTDPATIGLTLLLALIISTDKGVVKVEKKIGRGIVHVMTLGKK